MRWRWLKGHAGHDENERCDVLANIAIDRIQREFSREQLRAHLHGFSAATANPAELPVVREKTETSRERKTRQTQGSSGNPGSRQFELEMGDLDFSSGP